MLKLLLSPWASSSSHSLFSGYFNLRSVEIILKWYYQSLSLFLTANLQKRIEIVDNFSYSDWSEMIVQHLYNWTLVLTATPVWIRDLIMTASWGNSSLNLKGHILYVQSLIDREASREVGMRLTWNSLYMKNFKPVSVRNSKITCPTKHLISYIRPIPFI